MFKKVSKLDFFFSIFWKKEPQFSMKICPLKMTLQMKSDDKFFLHGHLKIQNI